MTLRSFYIVFGLVGVLAFAALSAEAQQPSAQAPAASPSAAQPNPTTSPATLPVIAAPAPSPNGITVPPLVTASTASAGTPSATAAIPATENPALTIGGAAPPPAAPTGPVLTLDQVVAQVLADNPTIVQSRLAAQRAHALIPEATGQGLPQVRIGGNDTYSSSPSSSASSGSTGTVSSTSSIPVITDSAYNSLNTSSGSTSSSSLSGTSITSTGSGTSSTPSTTTTIVPVGATPSAGSVQTNDQSNISPTAPSSGSSSGTSTSGTGQAVLRQTPSPLAVTGTSVVTGLRVNNYDADGSVTQIIDIFGLVHAASSAAKENAAFADLDLQRIEDDTALSAKTTYFAVLKAQSDVATDQELLRNAQATLANAQIQYKAGASPQLNVISSQAEVASAQADLIVAQNELDIERANLNNLLARAIDTPVNVAVTDVPTVPSGTSTDQQIALAEKQRPEVQQTNLTQAIAHNLTSISRQGLLPSLGLTGAVDYNPYPSELTGSSHYDESITATVSVPLYDGGETRSAVKAAHLSEQTERSVADQLQQNVALEVKTALVNVIDAQELVTADQAAVASYRATLNIAAISYQAGVGTLLDVTNAEANLANSESSLNSASYQQQTAYATLERAEGRR